MRHYEGEKAGIAKRRINTQEQKIINNLKET